MSTSAKIVADSISSEGVRLTTFELTYPRMVHAELMTHRALSRNAASSRAIPIEKMITQVLINPAYPVRWGLNGSGMQDHGEMTPFGQKRMMEWWLASRDAAVKQAREALGFQEQAHKQIINRILEPYMHITVLVTATEWNNFWALRDHRDADPTLGELARKMHTLYIEHLPGLVPNDGWHLPYIVDADIEDCALHVLETFPNKTAVTEELEDAITTLMIKLSVARCARVSYLTHDQRKPDIKEDLGLYDRLVDRFPLHASPLEHQAQPDTRMIVDWSTGEEDWCNKELHGNFIGWKQHRKTIWNENVPTNK